MKLGIYNIYKCKEKVKGSKGNSFYKAKDGDLITEGTMLSSDYVDVQMKSFSTSGIYYKLDEQQTKKLTVKLAEKKGEETVEVKEDK